MSAEDDLQEAIEAAVRETEATPGLVVTEYVVVAAAQGWDGEGADVTAVTIIPSGSEHRCMGLVEHARLRFHADVLSSYGPDDEP